MIEYTAKAIGLGALSWRFGPHISFEKPKDAIPLLMLLDESEKKHGGYVNIRIDLPRRPRTVGPRSQNSRFYGHCEDIAEQVVDDSKEPIYSKEQIHDAILRMSVEEGYPTYQDLNGKEAPLPDKFATVEQMNIVNKVLQRFADEHNFWLHEYVQEGLRKGEVYKSIGGRTPEEMEKYK